MNIKEIIYSFPTKHPNGFDQSELEELLKYFPKIDLEKFNSEIFGDTCLIDDINNLPIRYTYDIHRAIDIAITGRPVSDFEWD